MTEVKSNMPKGFTVVTESSATLKIIYRSRGLGCATLFVGFFVIWLGFVVLGHIYMLLVQPEQFFSSLLGALTLVFTVFALKAVSSTLLFDLFGTTEIVIDKSTFSLSRRFASLSNKMTLPRTEIKQLKQVQDGGDGIDSFPSWGLTLVAQQEHRIISKQAFDKSEWLGKKLATVSNVSFTRAI